MRESAVSMAQVTLTSETLVDAAVEMVHGLNREWRKDGVLVTLTALIVRACALALKEHPQLNSRLDGGQILLSPEINVGVAVDQEAGLIVPVVRAADRMSLQMVAKTVRELTEKAREDKLRPEDVLDGTFTVSSLEGTGVDAFTPIINPPQAAILGVGRVRDVAAFEGASVVKRQATTLSLTFDHRVTDGAPAARFLERVAELLGRPYLLM
jgi:pyruvate dehydrogenase E2 component (dihydrolipoamide acetyltransferase)